MITKLKPMSLLYTKVNCSANAPQAPFLGLPAHECIRLSSKMAYCVVSHGRGRQLCIHVPRGGRLKTNGELNDRKRAILQPEVAQKPNVVLAHLKAVLFNLQLLPTCELCCASESSLVYLKAHGNTVMGSGQCVSALGEQFRGLMLSCQAVIGRATMIH